MRFTVVQRIPLDADLVAEAFTQPGLYGSFVGLTKVDRPEIIDRQAEGDTVRLWVRYRFRDRLNGAVRAVVDPAKLTWVDESVHDIGARRVRFTLHPDDYADQLRCSGTYRIEADGDGCRRIGDIDATVTIPVVRRAVERAIESGLREHLAEETDAIVRYLTSQTA